MYRQYQDLGRNVDVKQVVLPKSLREYVMSVAHDSIAGAHLGIRRTKDKVLRNFYWTGVDDDVTRYCRSCDVCQRTVQKGTVPRVPLEKFPLIDTPFKRVAIDLVGLINPPSEAGHRFILTLVDYATRFAEAVPFRKIDTESVAEALVDIYSRLGVPEEVLSDQGRQFVSLHEGGLPSPWHQTENHNPVPPDVQRTGGEIQCDPEELSNLDSGTSTSTLFCLLTERCYRSPRTLPHSSCCMGGQSEGPCISCVSFERRISKNQMRNQVMNTS
ncbi:gypsy retrotransposon integrase-like protein 1 [Plakobranchus ocellatus]|uniref:Gypsy retrotransposon integrase-like protein 1 n=1 Tax=Plakobranchus ocellatus TaxID=259542 RepID=A0AAV4BCP2_9GAST|nr:gypsy retrotransposon integrase-like protein 1 [Plakobranchus ocellatus]